MNDLLEYRGFAGSVHYRTKDVSLYGRILGVTDLVTYEGQSAKELKAAFERAVDDYIALCERLGAAAKKPYRGSFSVRVSPELHQKAAETAMRSNRSLNEFVEQAIRKTLGESSAEATDLASRHRAKPRNTARTKTKSS